MSRVLCIAVVMLLAAGCSRSPVIREVWHHSRAVTDNAYLYHEELGGLQRITKVDVKIVDGKTGSVFLYIRDAHGNPLVLEFEGPMQPRRTALYQQWHDMPLGREVYCVAMCVIELDGDRPRRVMVSILAVATFDIAIETASIDPAKTRWLNELKYLQSFEPTGIKTTTFFAEF